MRDHPEHPPHAQTDVKISCPVQQQHDGGEGRTIKGGETQSDSMMISINLSAFPSAQWPPLCRRAQGPTAQTKRRVRGRRQGWSNSTLVPLPLTFSNTLEGIDMAMLDFGPQQSQRYVGSFLCGSSMEYLGRVVLHDNMKVLISQQTPSRLRAHCYKQERVGKSVLWMYVHGCSYCWRVWVGGHCWFISYSHTTL